MPTFKKVQVGDPLRPSASMHNALVDLLGKGPRTGAGDVIRSHQCSGIVDVHNTTSIDLTVGQILGTDDPLFTPDDNQDGFRFDPSLKGETPSVSYHLGKFAILAEPIPHGCVGRCYISGLAPARIYVNNIDDTHCDVMASKSIGSETCYLGTGGRGAQILWRENAGSGIDTIVWAVVRLENDNAPRWFKLKDNLYECDKAEAYTLLGSPSDGLGKKCIESSKVYITDPHNLVDMCSLAQLDESSGNNGGKSYIPSGTHVLARFVKAKASAADYNRWEALLFATGSCCGEESSSSSSSSSSSDSSSSPESSSSESSQSESSKSESSNSESSGSKSTPSGSGSDKSNAIVPVSWNKTGYAALHTFETPEIRFGDVMTVTVRQKNTTIDIDPRYLEVCEPGTVQICGCQPDMPVVVGAVVKGNKVQLRFADEKARAKVQLVISLTGIRKGFAGWRFPDRTRRQFEANERFIKSAYPR